MSQNHKKDTSAVASVKIYQTLLFLKIIIIFHITMFILCVCMFMGEDNYLSNNYIYPQYGWTHTHARDI